MTRTTCFRINAPDVVSETIDGESVIINLYKGLYYNLNPVGSIIWELVLAGYTANDTVSAFKVAYPSLSEADELSIVQLVDQLSQESLIVSAAAPSPTAAPTITADETFEQPILYKYADMQDLLALDPIHDVDENGWPNQQPAPAAVG
ncbi:MAG: PqqD family peptide modification chaperone [Cyanobacteria bacterium J06632_22]